MLLTGFTADDRYPLLNHKYLHYGVVAVAANWAAGIDGAECVVLATVVNINVTLPDAAKFRHAAFYVKNANTGGNIAVLAPFGAFIDGSPNVSQTLASNESALFVSDGTNWWILADYAATFPLPP